jgi:multidrug transporter EmrE-like cation transporter
MGYLFLILTVISETVAVIFMKLSNGFQNRLQAAIAVLAYFLSFIFLTYALRHMPVGLANAVWAGASTVLVAILGVFIFKEHLTIVQFIFLSMIVIGLIGLNLSKSL